MVKKTLAIIGAGHLGQQIAHYAISDFHYSKIVFFDDVTDLQSISGHRVLGKTNDVLRNYSEGKFDELLIGFGYRHIEQRKKFFETYQKTIPFGKIIHSSCWIDKTANIEDGCVLYPHCIIEPNVKVGLNTLCNIACSVSHDSSIGSHNFLSPRVTLAGFVKIGESCILGINSTIIDNIKLCNGVQLGAGTVVINSINKKGLYVGNPHRFIR